MWTRIITTVAARRLLGAARTRPLAAVACAAALLAHPLAIASAAAPPADLAGMSLEQLMDVTVTTVYAASLYRQDAGDAPASVTVLTADEIKRFGWRTLTDALGAVRSFHLGNDRLYDFVGVRGLQRPGDFNSRVLLQIDGHAVNENIYGGGFFGRDGLVDLALVDRIEIIRGPGSSLYGTNAFFAVVNVVTRTGGDVDGVEIQGEIGSRDTLAGRLSYGRAYDGGLQVLLSGTRLSSAGEARLYVPAFDAPHTNGGIAEDADGEDDADLFVKISKSGFTLEGVFTERDKTAPSAPYGSVFNTDQTVVEDRRAFVDLGYESPIGERGALAAHVFYDSYRFRGSYLYDFATPGDPPALVLNDDEADGAWWGLRAHVVHPAGVHLLTAGAEFLRHERQDQRNFDVEPLFVYLDDARQSVNWGLFVQDEVRVSRRFTLNLGLRYDDYDSFGGTLNPRVALIHRPGDATSVKLIYGTAFRAPNTYELYASSVDQYKANPDLEPETVATYEMLVEQRLGASAKLSAGAFHYHVRDVIALVEDPDDGLFYYDNAGRIEATGGEIELSGRWGRGWRAAASYAYQDVSDAGSDAGSDDRVVNSPRHVLKGRLLAPVVPEKLYLGAEARRVSRRMTTSGDFVGAHTLVSATLSTGPALFAHVELALSVTNLFDASYDDPTADDFVADRLVQYGRTFNARATVRF